MSLAAAVLRGLAPDGGLYVPEPLPRLAWPPPSEAVHGDDLRAISHWAAPALFPSVDREAISSVVQEALDFPVPLLEVEPGRWILELFHGPTHAFKDVGARFMARLMSALNGGRGAPRTVLVATSGDTGGAVASAFHRMEGYRVVVLFPRGGISERQRRQMTTLGGNVLAVAVEGTFDDCQRLAKEAFGDAALRELHGMTSANSINVARLLPQALYYLHAASRLDSPWFVVPSGNLGNLCAGLLARRAGMSASGFTAATNENDGFVSYLKGEDFRPRASVSTTSSAMDVGDPSNLERIVWLYHGRHAEVRRAVRGVSVDQTEVQRCISDLHERTGYVADPHTAVAYAASQRHEVEREGPLVILATAHPSKFPDTVEEAIGRRVPLAPGLAAALSRSEDMVTMSAHLHDLTDLLAERCA